MTEEEYLNRRAMAQGNVPEPQPVTVNPSTGGIQPIKQSGLYAIYNQRNPYSAQAERLSAMSGRDMGGRLGWLPGVVATLQSGSARRNSEEFEAKRQEKLDAIIAANDAWEKIQNDKEAQLRDIKLAKELVEPKAAQAYIQKYNETKDLDLASDFAAQAYNAAAKEANLTALPVMTKFTMWDGGEATAIWNDATQKPVQGKIDKNGNLAKMNEKGQFVPVDRNDMLLSAYNQKVKAERPTGASTEGMQDFYDKDMRKVGKSKDQDAMVKKGAVFVGEKVVTEDEDGIRTITIVPRRISGTTIDKTTGRLENTNPTGHNPPPKKAVEAQINYGPQNLSGGQAAQPPAPARNKRAEAIAILEGQKQKLTEANISYVMGQLQ